MNGQACLFPKRGKDIHAVKDVQVIKGQAAIT